MDLLELTRNLTFAEQIVVAYAQTEPAIRETFTPPEREKGPKRTYEGPNLGKDNLFLPYEIR